MVGTATSKIGDSMKGELELTVEPKVNENVPPSMEGKSITMSYAKAMSFRSRFARNAVRRRITNFYEGATNLFSNAVGLIGFGGDE